MPENRLSATLDLAASEKGADIPENLDAVSLDANANGGADAFSVDVAVDGALADEADLTSRNDSVAKGPYRRKPPVQRVATTKPTWVPPDWFLPPDGSGYPDAFIGYLPWIREHSEALIDLIRPSTNAPLIPIRLVADISSQTQRKEAMLYASEHPDYFRKLVASHLTPLVGRIRGIVFTFDWHPYMRVISKICADLGIPRILVPHESVFADREMYYVHTTTGIDIPSADVVLAWGNLQKSIFIERGYPEERIIVTGAPKFDIYSSQGTFGLDRRSFAKIYNFSPTRPIILFAAQPLDSQFDRDAANLAQRKCISDLMLLCEKNNWQLLVRLPPSRAFDILGNALRAEIAKTTFTKTDYSGFYCTTARGTLMNVDAVVSINSTMLFEAVLSGKPAVSAMYMQFESFWTRVNIPRVENEAEMAACLEAALKGNSELEISLDWAKEQLSVGEFDGLSSQRVSAYLNRVFSGELEVSTWDPSARFIVDSQARSGNIAFHSLAALETTHRYMPAMLGAHNIGMPKAATDVLDYDSYVRWGAADTSAKRKLDALFGDQGISPVYVEDGFIRSLSLGVLGDPGLSIILDDLAAYYDATQTSRMQEILNSDFSLTPQQQARAERLISEIVSSRISKYNHAPERDLKRLRSKKRAILLVDQRLGDQSIEQGLASQETFWDMILTAIEQEKNSDVFVKIHPDAITGGKQSSLTPGLEMLRKRLTVHALTEDINPYSIFDVVDEVWTVTSGMGFEALMAGKAVRCFGAPFYAGRGVTVDEIPLPSRNKKRSIIELFHVAYLMLSRYYDPRADKPCELEGLLDYINHQKFIASENAMLQAKSPTSSRWPALNISGQLHLAQFSELRDGREIAVKSGHYGHAFYGPYLLVNAGAYVIEFTALSESRGEETGRFVFEVAIGNGNMIIAQHAVSGAQLADGKITLSLEFTIPEGLAEDMRKLEFRGWTDGKQAFAVSSVTLQRV